MKKKLLAMMLAGVLAMGLCACGGSGSSSTEGTTAAQTPAEGTTAGEAASEGTQGETTAAEGTEAGAAADGGTLTVAYQYGLAYAPLTIMQEQGLIEKNYNGNLKVEWINLNSGSAINEGVVSGDIDVANMGVGPFITGVTAGIPYKMYGTIAAQPHKLMTNNDSINSLSDITADQKIALVNIGSIQHILLGMMAKQQLGDPHALDNNLVAMAHPDGMSALLAGSVDCQLTTSPYIFMEAKEEGIHEVAGLEEVWPQGNAFIVGLVSDDLVENRPDVYEAVVAATQEAMDFLNNNQEEAAAILCEKEDVTAETMLEWMQDPGCAFDMKLPGVMDMAEFMAEAEFIEKAPESFEAITTESAR